MKIVLLCLEIVTMGALAMEDSELLSTKASNKKSFLRGSDATANNNVFHRGLNSVFCGCPGCDTSAYNVYAGGHKCGDRIDYLQNDGFSEQDACAKVAGDEFPVECGVCDPNSCNQQSTEKCGCPECEDVWNTMAGTYSCGERIEWLQSPMSTSVGGPYGESISCSKVASEEYPSECGKCDPSVCNDPTDVTSSTPSKIPTLQPTKTPTKEPTSLPTKPPTKEPTSLPTKPPTETPTQNPTIAPNQSYIDPQCGCLTCDDSIWNTLAGDHTCGDRILYLQTSGSSERDACSTVAGIEFPFECGNCDPDRCDNNNNPSQKCGGAVDSSSNSETICQRDLWNPTGDSTMYCFAYGGSGDPCHLNNNNDPNDGIFKDPSACYGDTFYLWDEPDTQNRSYDWAGTTWLDYSRRFDQELQDFRARGAKVSSPLLKAGGPGELMRNLREFFNACGSPCTDPSDPAYIDVIAINAFCGDFNGASGCRGGAAFIYNEAVATSSGFNNIPVYITNWSRLQTSNPQDQVDAIDAIDEFFPISTNLVVERVYWFGATDFGGGSSNNFLTQILVDGSTLGERWRNKCDSL